MLAKLALSQLSAQDSKSICLKGPKAGGKWHQWGSSLTEDGWELADLGDGQILCGHILLILKAMYTADPWHPCHVLCGVAFNYWAILKVLQPIELPGACVELCWVDHSFWEKWSNFSGTGFVLCPSHSWVWVLQPKVFPGWKSMKGDHFVLI